MKKLYEQVQELGDIVGFYREPQVLEIYPISNSSLWDGSSKGIYPKPKKMAPKMTGWLKRDIHLLCLMIAELDDYFQFIKENGGSFKKASEAFIEQIVIQEEGATK